MGKEPARRRLRRVEGFTTTEVPDDEKPPLLRVFLARRARETQGHFAAAPEATDAGFRDLSPEHPVFAMRNSDGRGATRLRQPDTLRRGGGAVPTSLRFALADGRLYAATPPTRAR